MDEAYKKLGLTLIINNYPWPRSLITANRGGAQRELFRAIVIENEYANLVRVSVPVGSVDFYGVVLDSTLVIKRWEDLKEYRITYLLGGKYLQNKTKGMDVVEVTNLDRAFLLVQRKRVDIYIGVTPQVTLLKRGITDLHILEDPLGKVPLYHYLHSEQSGLKEPLERVLKEMHDNGRIEVIKDSVLHAIVEELQKSSK